MLRRVDLGQPNFNQVVRRGQNLEGVAVCDADDATINLRPDGWKGTKDKQKNETKFDYAFHILKRAKGSSASTKMTRAVVERDLPVF